MFTDINDKISPQVAMAKVIRLSSIELNNNKKNGAKDTKLVAFRIGEG